jgi:inner membrane protein involved in colicin E2 resistance
VSETKTHPVAGIIFAIVLAVLAVLLVGALNTMEAALIAAPFLIGWAVLAAVMFGPADH